MKTQISSIPSEIKSNGDGTSSVVLMLDDAIAYPFVLLLSSLTEIMRGLNCKLRNSAAGIEAYSEESILKRKQYYDSYVKCVISTFNEFIDQKQSAKQAISLTSAAVRAAFPNSCYDNVKKILTTSGSLKKSRFYEK